jgi:hypothetical protein
MPQHTDNLDSLWPLVSAQAELKILQDEAIALTSWALTWFLGKVIPTLICQHDSTANP